MNKEHGSADHQSSITCCGGRMEFWGAMIIIRRINSAHRFIEAHTAHHILLLLILLARRCLDLLVCNARETEDLFVRSAREIERARE